MRNEDKDAFDSEPLSVTMPKGMWYALLKYLDAMESQEKLTKQIIQDSDDDEAKEVIERICAYGVTVRLCVSNAVLVAKEEKDANK